MSSSGLAEADAEELAVLDAPDMASAAPPGSQTAPTQQHPNKRVRRTKAAADEPEEEDSDGDESAPGVKAKRSAADKKAFAASASAQISAIRREQAKAQKARLRFLLGQSEIFRHFIENLDGPLANPTDNVAPAASFSSPHLGAEAGVSEEIGEALLLSPMRAAAAAHHKDGTGAAMTDAPPSPKASGVVVPLSPPPSVRRTRSDASAAVAPAAASGATAGAVEGKTRKRARSAKAGAGKGGRGGDDAADDEEGADGEFLVRPATRLLRQPSSVKGTMRDYQLEGLNWMISLHENGLNGILADEMGLGKTLQSISLLAYTHEFLGNDGPHLVLVPKSTLGNWIIEFGRFCPSLKVLKLHGDKDERAETIKSILHPGMTAAERGWHVCVTTYEVAVIEKGPLSRLPWQYLVIDEAHRIKNENSALATVVRTFTTAHRLLITGTPLQNNLHELWALLNFLLPDVFGDAAAFDSWFNLASDTADEEAKEKTVKQLHRVLKPFMLRRLKSDVAKSLPPKTETLLYVGMSAVQRELYRSILMRDVDAVLNTGAGAGSTRLSNLLMHLRKACNHPYTFDGVEDRSLDPLGEHVVTASAKLMLLDKLLPRLREKGSRVLIFSQMTSVLDILEDYCRMRSYEYSRIDGSCGYDTREEAIESFNRPGSSKFIFLLSTRAGGLGINLATADVVILHDSDWNPQVDLQAQDRAHRIGQTKPVQVYRLVTTGSVEEKMVERALFKLKLDAVVVQQGRLADASKGMSKEDMLEMIRFGADAVFKGSGGDFTDADIDSILELGRSKTQAMNSAIDKRAGVVAGGAGRSMLDFKLDGGLGTQTFEGVDFSDEAARAKEKERELQELKSAALGSMSLGDRAAKLGSVPPIAFNDVAVGGKSEAARRRQLLPPAHRPPASIYPWMLLDGDRINEITTREVEHILASRAAAAAAPTGVASDSAAAAASMGPFPAELVAERARLVAEGFPSWKLHDLEAYVQACTDYGRDDSASVVRETAKACKRSVAEVQRYHEAFWIRGPKTFTTGVKHNWQKLQARVERGEAVLKESAQACAALAVHIARSIPSYAAPPHLLQPGASRASLAALPAPPADVLSSMLQSGVPFATNPWRYIPLSYSTANPWGHSAAVSAPPPPKYMTVGLAKGARSVGDSIVSPFSSLAPVALPSTAWSCPPLPASSRVPAQATLRTGAPAAPAAADAAPLTLTAILTPGLEAAAAHNPHRLLTEHAALSLSRAGYVASNDAFLLSAIARYGGVSVCSFDAIAEDIRRDPAHMLDTFFRSRSPAQLEARAKVLLKCVLRDVVDTQRRPDKALADEAKQAQKRLTITYARIADEMARAIVIQEMIGDTGSAMHLLPSGKGLEAIDSEEDGAPKATGPSSGKAANAEKPKPPAGSRKIVPDSLVGELLRTIAAAGRAGIDSVAVDFLESPAVQNYAEDLAVEAAAASSTALLDAEAIRANADKLKPSKAQVKHYIDVLAFKDNGPRAIPSGVWRVRPDYAAVARMSDSEVAAWISANPLPPPKPKAKKAGDDAKPDAEDTAGAVAVETTAAVTVESGAAAVEPAGAVAAAPAEATAVPDVEDALTTPEMKGGALVALASLVAAAGREGIEHIVAEFLAYPAEVCRAASKTKSAIRRDIKAIATRDKFWRLMPAYEYLLKEPMPPREEVASTIAAPSAVGEAASAAMEAATGDDAVAAPPPVVAGTVASGGSLLGLGGAAKPRISL